MAGIARLVFGELCLHDDLESARFALDFIPRQAWRDVRLPG